MVGVTSWVESVSEERLQANYHADYQSGGWRGETDVMAVVKANAYGHGVEVCSAALARAGARWLGVASVSEGARARRALGAAGFFGVRILLMCGFLAEDAAAIAEHALTPVVWTAEHVDLLRGTGVAAHVEVDTGMGRQGVKPGAALDALLDAMAAASVRLDGMMTHFSAAEVVDSELTREQRRRFDAAVGQVSGKGLRPAWVHAGSSSSVDNPVGPDSQDPWLVEERWRRVRGRGPWCGAGLRLSMWILPAD